MKLHAHALVIALLFGSAPLCAATFTVTTNADSGPGSLRSAIESANATSGTHTINFNLAPNTTINLITGLPLINRAVVIVNGAAVPGLTINGNGTASIFLLGATNTSFVLNDIKLESGRYIYGGGCLGAAPPAGSNSSIVLNRVVFQQCASVASSDGTSNGGAIHVTERGLSINGARFVDSTTLPTGASAPNEARGGAIYVSTSQPRLLVIQDSHFIGNRAVSADNRIAQGGAISVRGPFGVTIDGTRFIDNAASGTLNSRGAAIDAEDSQNILIENSLFFGNYTDGNRTIYAQSSVGNFHLRNTTFVSNMGTPAVDARYASIVVRNNTFAENVATSASAVDHLVLVGNAGTGIAPITVTNNLLLPRSGADDLLCSVAGNRSLTVQYNVMAGRTMMCGPQNTSTLHEVRVDALRDNGGRVETLALRSGSSAIGAGNPASPSAPDLETCLGRDARGVSRPQDGNATGTPRCDAGAWESDGEAPLFRHDFDPVLWRPVQ